MTIEHVLTESEIAVMINPVNDVKNKYVVFVIGKSKRLIKFKSFVDKANMNIKDILKRINK